MPQAGYEPTVSASKRSRPKPHTVRQLGSAFSRINCRYYVALIIFVKMITNDGCKGDETNRHVACLEVQTKITTNSVKIVGFESGACRNGATCCCANQIDEYH
jgi:hypothetical protein